MKLTDGQQAERRARILDAAERCFVRDGFHRTAMQAIASEAGISPGALYLYFDSKDALIIGLVERDRARIVADFEAAEAAADPLAGLMDIGRKYLQDGAACTTALTLPIWAEALRNPEVAAVVERIEAAIHERMVRVLNAARARGLTAPDMDAEFVAELFETFADGLFKRRALHAGLTGERAMALAAAMLRLAVAGAAKPQRPFLAEAAE